MTPEYRAWMALKQRCQNKNLRCYKDYGGRGITFASDWGDSFSLFLAAVGRRPGPNYSIERIKNDQGYVQGNVRWATKKEQSSNTRMNRNLTFKGVTLCLSEWARRIGLTTQALYRRLDVYKWEVDRALTQVPKRDHRRNEHA